MSIRKIAALIPAEYRKEILELNIIDQAIAIASNPGMEYLTVIWKNYVEPDFTGDCNLCFGRVLNNFKEMKKTLIAMEQEDRLLQSV